MSKLTPVRLHKAGEINLPTTSLGKAPSSLGSSASQEPEAKHEPQARLVEVQPGIYDIMVTCSCGEQTVVRCESIAPSGTTSSSPTSSPPKTKVESPTEPPTT